MSVYSITIHNESPNAAQAIVFQRDPQPISGEYSLVWLSTDLTQSMTAQFEWETDYGFVWGPMHRLEPGAVFRPSELLPADPAARNEVTLSGSQQSPHFTSPRQGAQRGSLVITNNGDVPADAIAEGIAQSGKPVLVIGAQPNIEAIFTLQPEYWIAFGDFEQGEVLDAGLTAASAATRSKIIYGAPVRIAFPAGVFAMTATLKADNTWAINSTPGGRSALVP